MAMEINRPTLPTPGLITGDQIIEDVKDVKDQKTGGLPQGTTLTITTKEGQEFTITLPALDIPNDDKVNQYFDNRLLGGSQDNTGTDDTGGTQGGTSGGVGSLSQDSEVLNDIYQIMKLFHEIFKDQRKAARELRNAERQQQMTEIDNEVAELRNAAMITMATGLASAAITLGMAAYSGAKIARGIGRQLQINKLNTFNGTRAKLASINTRINKLENQLKTFKANQQSKINNLSQRLENAKAKLTNIKTKEAQIQKNISKLESKLASVKQKIATSKGKTKFEAEMEAKKLSENLQAEKAELKNVQSERELMEGNVKIRQQELDKAKTQYGNGVKNLENKLNQAKAEKTQLEAKLQKIFDKLTPEDQKLAGMDKKTLNKGIRGEQSKLDYQMRKLDVYNMATQALGQAVSAMGQGFSQLAQAAAEKHKGEAAKWESKAQEEQDWMNSMRDLLKDVAAKLQAMEESRTETLKSIFRV